MKMGRQEHGENIGEEGKNNQNIMHENNLNKNMKNKKIYHHCEGGDLCMSGGGAGDMGK